MRDIAERIGKLLCPEGEGWGMYADAVNAGIAEAVARVDVERKVKADQYIVRYRPNYGFYVANAACEFKWTSEITEARVFSKKHAEEKARKYNCRGVISLSVVAASIEAMLSDEENP